MIIETPRLRLRPIDENDIDGIVTMLNDWEVAQWLSIPPYPYKAADAEKFIQIVTENHSQENPGLFGIAKKDNDEIMGCINFVLDEKGEAGVGYWMGKKFWKNGYGSESLAAIVRHSQTVSCRSMLAVIDPENTSSRKLLERFNFKVSGNKDLPEPTRRGCIKLDVLTRTL